MRRAKTRRGSLMRWLFSVVGVTIAMLLPVGSATAAPPDCTSPSLWMVANGFMDEGVFCKPAGTNFKVESKPSHAASFTMFTKTGEFFYGPEKDFVGKDSFTYRAKNADGESGLNTVTIQVYPARCFSISQSTHPNQSLFIAPGWLSDHFCESESAYTFEIADGPQHGSITSFDPATGALTYMPDAGFSEAQDSIGYRIKNSLGVSPTATIFIAVGNEPSCKSFSVSTIPTTFPLKGEPITLHCEGFNSWGYLFAISRYPFHGSISDFDEYEGTLTYFPSIGHGGPDSFTYVAYNGIGESKEATVSIEVEPWCESSEVTARPDEPFHTHLSCHGKGPLTYELGDSPEHGAISDFDPENGTLTYTPNSGFRGEDRIGFKASNALGSSGFEANQFISVCGGPGVETYGEVTEPGVSGVGLQVWASAGEPTCEEDELEARVDKLQVYVDDKLVYSEEKNCDDPERPCSRWLGRNLQLPYEKVVGTHTYRVEAEDQLGFKAPPVEWTETTDEISTVSKVPPDAGTSTKKECTTPQNRGIATKDHPSGYRIRGNTLFGTGCADIISVQPGVQVYRGEGGDDKIRSGGGNETIKAGAGDDTVFGGRGTDVLLGGNGNDRLDAGVGDDEVAGAKGEDTLIGNAGADDLRGGADNDVLRGGTTTDKISGGGGTNNTLSYAEGISPGFEIGPNSVNPQTNQVPGFPGKHADRGVYVNLSGNPGFIFDNSAVARFGGGSDVVNAAQIQNVVGTAFADLIVGSSAANVINAGPGTDIVRGGGGGDQIYGGADSDFLDGEGEQGAGTVHGGTGSDTCLNGGDPSCEGSNPKAGVTATPATKIKVGLFEPENLALNRADVYVRGSNGGDNVTATWSATKVHLTAKGSGTGRFDTADNKVSGCTVKEAAADCPIKGTGAIVMHGGAGKDVLKASEFPTAMTVTLLGGTGGDTLEGGDQSEDVLVDGTDNANDILRGNGSDDALFQNEGADVLDAGDGNDLFISSTVCDGDTFQGGDGNDNANWAQLVGPEINPNDPLYPAGDEPVYENPPQGVEAFINDEASVDRQGKEKCSVQGKILNVENLEGSRAGDVLIGNDENNYLLGRGAQTSCGAWRGRTICSQTTPTKRRRKTAPSSWTSTQSWTAAPTRTGCGVTRRTIPTRLRNASRPNATPVPCRAFRASHPDRPRMGHRSTSTKRRSAPRTTPKEIRLLPSSASRRNPGLPRWTGRAEIPAGLTSTAFPSGSAARCANRAVCVWTAKTTTST